MKNTEIELGKTYGRILKEGLKTTILKGEAVEITKNGYIKLKVFTILNFFKGEYESGFENDLEKVKYFCFPSKNLKLI